MRHCDVVCVCVCVCVRPSIYLCVSVGVQMACFSMYLRRTLVPAPATLCPVLVLKLALKHSQSIVLASVIVIILYRRQSLSLYCTGISRYHCIVPTSVIMLNFVHLTALPVEHWWMCFHCCPQWTSPKYNEKVVPDIVGYIMAWCGCTHSVIR